MSCDITRLARTDWNLVLGCWEEVGPRTVAEHTGLAVVEWHIHAWDLARSSGKDHRPHDPEIVAAGRQQPGESIETGDAWVDLLRESGRGVPWLAVPTEHG